MRDQGGARGIVNAADAQHGHATVANDDAEADG